MCKLSPQIIGAALTATTCDERFIARLTKIISDMDNCDDVLETLIWTMRLDSKKVRSGSIEILFQCIGKL